jgi:preprotein translocase subunit YajC
MQNAIELLIPLLIIIWLCIFIFYLITEYREKREKEKNKQKLTALLKEHDQVFKKDKE